MGNVDGIFLWNAKLMTSPPWCRRECEIPRPMLNFHLPAAAAWKNFRRKAREKWVLLWTFARRQWTSARVAPTMTEVNGIRVDTSSFREFLRNVESWTGGIRDRGQIPFVPTIKERRSRRIHRETREVCTFIYALNLSSSCKEDK